MNKNSVKFKTFSNIIEESKGDISRLMSRDARSELLTSIIESNYYEEPITEAFNIILENKLTDKLFEGTLSDSDIAEYLNEADIIGWFKDKADKVKDKAANALSGAEQFVKKVGGKFKSVANLISEALTTFFKKAWDFVFSTVKGELNKGKKEAEEESKMIAEKMDEEELKATDNEISTMTAIMKSTLNYFMKGMPKEVAKGVAQAGDKVEVGRSSEEKGGEKDSPEKNERYEWKDVYEHSTYLAIAELIKQDPNIIKEIEEFDESLLNEASEGLKIPFLSKIVHWITDNVPPFSQLAKIEQAVAKFANNKLTKFSQWATRVAKAPGPKTFPNLSNFLGLFAGAKIKMGVKTIVKVIAKKGMGLAIINAFPGVGMILSWMKTIATFIWYFEIIEMSIDLVAKASLDDEKYDKFKKSIDDADKAITKN